MIQRELNRLNMVLQLIGYCTVTSSVTSGITNFATLLAQIILKKGTLLNWKQIADDPTTGVTANAHNLRLTMEQICLIVSKGIYAYALTPPVNFILKAQSKLVISDLTLMTKTDSWTKSVAIYNLGFDNSAAIVPFGITAGELLALQDANDNFEAVLEASSAAIETRKNANIEANLVLDDIILNDLVALDAMAETLAISQSAWFSSYKSTRGIDDLGTGTTRLKYRLMYAGNPINNAQSNIINTMNVARPRTEPYPTKNSTPDGIIIHDKLGTGLFVITIAKTGFKTKTLTGKRVKLGGNVDLGDINLSPIIILKDKINPGTFAASPGLPSGTPPPAENSPVNITVDNPNALYEFWFCPDDDISGNPEGYTISQATHAQPFDGTTGEMGFSLDTPKLMARNTGTIKGQYTLEATIE